VLRKGVNLAQPTGLGSGPCGRRPKKPTLKKALIKEAHRAKNSTKSCGTGPTHRLPSST